MKKIFLFMALCLTTVFTVKAEDQIYAVWDASTTTLTLRYDDQQTTNNGVTYWSVYKTKATKVVLHESMQSARPTSTAAWFYAFEKLTEIQHLEYLNTSKVTNMMLMFADCVALESITFGSSFTTAKVTNMASMFSGCNSLQTLNLSSFNTANVTNMINMFGECTALESITFGSSFTTANVTSLEWMFFKCEALKSLNLSSFDTKNVTSMDDMFYRCKALESITFGSSFTTVNMTNMSDMFRDCKALKSLNLSSFDTKNVTNMSLMFCDCKALESITFGTSFNTENVTNMSSMFRGCNSLQTLNLSLFNTANVENMSNMFRGCSSLKTLDLSAFSIVNVVEMESMFRDCSSLEELSIPYFGTQRASTIYAMFSDCSALKTIYCNNDWSNSSADDESMFSGCTALTGEQGTKCNGTENIRIGYARPDEGTSKPGYFTKGCLGRIYTSYNSTTKTLTYYFDCDYSSRSQVEYYDPDVMRFTGYYGEVEKVVIDKSMQNAPLTTTEKMFYGGDGGGSNVGQLFKVDTIEGLENLNTSEVTDMRLMFFGCNSITSLDLRKFKMSKVTNTRYMFAYCSNLKTIRCNDDWSKLNNITDSENMFKGCTNLMGGHGTNLVDGGFTKPYAHPDCYDEGYYGYFTADKQVYTVFDGDTTLTYYCDDKIVVRTGKVELYRSWLTRFSGYNTQVKKAVIDASMADTLLTKMESMFYGNIELSKLEKIEGMEHLNTSNATSLACMFQGCMSLKSVDLSHFDTRNVTAINNMFYGCTELKELDFPSTFRVDKVRYMDEMFFNCSHLETIYCNGNWASEAPSAESKWMFWSCGELKGEEGTVYDDSYSSDLTYARPDGGTDNPGYFTQKRKLYTSFEGDVLTYYYDGLSESKSGTQEDYTPEAGHDKKRFAAYHDQIKKVVIDESLQRFQPTTLANMFDGGSGNELSALDTIEGLEYIDFSEVTDMYAMFAGCSSLKDINLSTFNTDKVTNMAFLFYDCSALKNPDMTGFSTANVTDMRRVFYGCSAITELDLNNFKTDKVTTVYKMFEGCSALTTIYSDNDWSSIADGGDMFKGCTALVGGNNTLYDVNHIDGAYARPDIPSQPGYFTKKTATAIDNTVVDTKAVKRIVNGQLLILRDGKTYNVMGVEVR